MNNTLISEVRVTNPVTGGEKGSKPCQLFWIDPEALEALGEVAGMGTEKYAPHNYRRGVNVSLHINAAFRHILKFQGGEDQDESGSPHLAHAAWNLLAAITQVRDHPELDDRFVAEKQSDPPLEVVANAPGLAPLYFDSTYVNDVKRAPHERVSKQYP